MGPVQHPRNIDSGCARCGLAKSRTEHLAATTTPVDHLMVEMGRVVGSRGRVLPEQAAGTIAWSRRIESGGREDRWFDRLISKQA